MLPSDYDDSLSENIPSDMDVSPHLISRAESKKKKFKSSPQEVDMEWVFNLEEKIENKFLSPINPSDSVSQISGAEISRKGVKKKLKIWNNIDRSGDRFKCLICLSQTYSKNTSVSTIKQHVEKYQKQKKIN